MVVTIVVLLILAGVSISLILVNNGIIQKSKDARRQYEQAKVNEEDTLNQINNTIDQYTKIKFYLETHSGVDTSNIITEYTVEIGTTWREFVREQKPCDEDNGQKYELFSNNDVETNVVGENGAFHTEDGVPVGVIITAGGGPVYESSGTISTGPWVYPRRCNKGRCSIQSS